MMGMLEGSGYEKIGRGSAAAIHYMAEVMRRFYADRSQYLGDPDFVKVPMAGLLDPAYIQKRRATIDPEHATPSDRSPGGHPEGSESTETTHYNVVDAEGNAVAVTYTLNGGYGNGITVPGAGFLLNNEMDDFAAKPGGPNMFGLVQGEANAIAARQAAALLDDAHHPDARWQAVHGGGRARADRASSPRVMQVILNVIDFGMNAQEAVDAPRFHHQWKPDRLSLERAFRRTRSRC